MIGDNLVSPDLKELIYSDNPDFEKIKDLVIKAYNDENSCKIKNINKISNDEQDKIIGWLNRCLENPNKIVTNLFLKEYKVKIPLFSQSLSSKINALSQYHCPICRAENQFPISIIPIRISAISKQAISKKKGFRKAFEKAIESRLNKKDIVFKKGDKLCVHIVFVLGSESRDKDLDNMAKALLDGLEGNLFARDIDIDHLNLLKIKHNSDEDYIIVNIRRTEINTHSDVLFNKMAHGWAGQDFLNLAEFIENQS